MRRPLRLLGLVLAGLASLGLGGPPASEIDPYDPAQPGSVLVFPRFVRGLTPSGLPRSSFEVSVLCPGGRTCPELTDFVRLKGLWVCPGTGPRSKEICRATDFSLRTTVRGTLWFNPEGSPQALSPDTSPPPGVGIDTPHVPTPPCAQGFLVLWVVNDLGHPLSFNALIGSAVLRATSQVASAHKAVAIQALGPAGTVVVPDPQAPLQLDGQSYRPLSGNVFGTVQYEPAPGEPAGLTTSLTFLTLDLRANAPNLTTHVALVFYNENQRPISTSVDFVCHKELRLTAIDANLTTRFGGLVAKKGLLESTGPATQQNTSFPFQTFRATLLGLVETREGNQRAHAHALFHDSVPVPTRLCPAVGSGCLAFP